MKEHTSRWTATHALLLGLSSQACGGGDLDVPTDFGFDEVSEALSAKLPFRCDGPITKGQPLHLPDSGVSVDVYTCWADVEEPDDHFVDANFRETDLDALRFVNKHAFVARHRFERDLEAELATHSSQVTADVWFDIPSEAHPPDKSSVLFMTAEETANASQRASRAMRKRAEELRQAIEAIAGARSVLNILGGSEQITPIITVRASSDVLQQIGDLDGITSIAWTRPRDEGLWSQWYELDLVAPVTSPPPPIVGSTGAGVTVADVYGAGGIPNTTYSGFVPGSCVPASGPAYKCYCPAAAVGSDGNHMAQAMGFVKALHPDLYPGVAPGASIILANDVNSTLPQCAGASFAGGVDWALTNGANVINRSASNSTSFARYLDYRATISPYPMVVSSAGNAGLTSAVGTTQMNALVVGGANDLHDPDRNNLKNMYNNSATSGSSSVNPDGLGAAGFELPHIIAPAKQVTTLDGDGSYKSVTGTSFSAPQVSGAAAVLMEKIGTKIWPEAVWALVMVGPEQSVSGGTLDLQDAVDDLDGAGSLNLLASWGAAATRVLPGSVSTYFSGYDMGIISVANDGTGYLTQGAWPIAILPGRTLTAAAIVFAHNTCTLGNENTCTGKDWPLFKLNALNTGGTVVKSSFNYNGNYAYVKYKNTGASTVTLNFKMFIQDWRSLPDTTYGVAFSQTIAP